jgi:hypothetical protein
MFIIVQDVINQRIMGEELFDCFDILAEPSGVPLKFKSEGEALGFLETIGMDAEDYFGYEFDRGVIKVARLQ